MISFISICERASRRRPNPAFINHMSNLKFYIQKLALKFIMNYVDEHYGKNSEM